MPLTTLWWNTEDGSSYMAQIRTTNVGRGLRSQYGVDILNSSGTLVAVGYLDNYPQWSESALGLVARAIYEFGFPVSNRLHQHTFHTPNTLKICLISVDISVATLPLEPASAYEIEGLHITISKKLATCRYRNDAFIGNAFSFLLPSEDHDACHIAVQAVCQTLWGTSILPPVPKPLRIPVHRWKGVRYVRLTDIPEVARREFSRHLFFREKPSIPIERKDNCVYESDWNDFLSGDLGFKTCLPS